MTMIELRPGQKVRTRLWKREGTVLKAYTTRTPCCGREVRLDARQGRPGPLERICPSCGVSWLVEAEAGCKAATWTPQEVPEG